MSARKLFVPSLRASLSTSPCDTKPEQRFFHHVRETTFKDLALPSERSTFWYDFVLPPAHTNEAVRHALVALGAAHWLFLTRPAGSSPASTEVASVQNVVLEHYNRAIQHLTSYMHGSDPLDFRLTLICCLVFFSLENAMGRYAESLQHLRAGSKLLASPTSSPASSGYSEPSSRDDDVVSEIAEIFSRLGVDASMFMNAQVVPDANSYSSPVMPQILVNAPFESLQTARRQLHALEIKFSHVLESCQEHEEQWQLQEIHDELRNWIYRFDIMQTRRPLDPAEYRELISLKMARIVWLAEIDGDGTSEDAFAEVLDHAEALVQSFSYASHRTFTLQADIIPALVFICDSSEDASVQRRALMLLRSMQRREGMWDSQEVAEYLEGSLSARMLLQERWDAVGGGIPGAVRALAGMSFAQLSPENNILLMTKQSHRGCS